MNERLFRGISIFTTTLERENDSFKATFQNAFADRYAKLAMSIKWRVRGKESDLRATTWLYGSLFANISISGGPSAYDRTRFSHLEGLRAIAICASSAGTLPYRRGMGGTFNVHFGRGSLLFKGLIGTHIVSAPRLPTNHSRAAHSVKWRHCCAFGYRWKVIAKEASFKDGASGRWRDGRYLGTCGVIWRLHQL
jgi:hypothetical protein